MIVGVPKESFPGEKRVALIPANAGQLAKLGVDVLVETGAGLAAGFTDAQYKEKGASIAENRGAVIEKSTIVLQVRALGANPDHADGELSAMRPGQILVGSLGPNAREQWGKKLAEQKVLAFAMEQMPRITRAQDMDILSSMATVAGYKAVLLAAAALPKMFPMLMTAAGTVSPARVFIVGAGVAGLQAIATAKRLGAVVHSYDIRPAVKEQVESLGAKFVDLGLDTGTAEDKGGYAKQMGEEFYRKQREVMTKVVAESDVVITTAAVPGKKAPILVTQDMVMAMKPGSVIVDLAAESGGNCELTEMNETVHKHGVQIIGPVNLATQVPFHASQMFSKNLFNFLRLIIKNGKPELDLDDECVADTLVAGADDPFVKASGHLKQQEDKTETTE
ncbi:Re/Si-specific NAD(P)(+) transhydrogenase subunit alpha [bacterium]|nr:Re/Si-specific NAD(P)(+) transhydrogenase subunit alpha [candidate division CSSED10-310 bacterium]